METRAALLRAVEEIVAESGAEAVTTTSVAERAAMSVGSLYRYFKDRNALLLVAYDDTVARISAICAERLAALPPDAPAGEAARQLLNTYLDTAETIPAHPGLLRAMRSLRTIESDQDGANLFAVSHLIAPFLKKFSPRVRPDPARLHFMNALLGNLVDLYLMSPPNRASRSAMRKEIEAHLLLALERTIR
ncbi:MAG: TetR/AcrR family transcriptional regulator [Parvibaculum sp.]